MEPIYKKVYENPVQYIIECLRNKNNMNKKSNHYESNLDILKQLGSSFKSIQNKIDKKGYFSEIYYTKTNNYIINLFGFKGIPYIENKNNISEPEFKLFIDLVVLSYLHPDWYENILEKYTQ